MVVKADSVTEEMEYFEVVISGVEVEDVSGVKRVLAKRDRERIILC